MRRLLLACSAAAVLAGCGGDSETTSSAAPAATTSAADASAIQIGMKGLQFEPKDVTVKAGTRVTWKNLEDIPHNVVAEKGAKFESDTFGKDGTFVFTAAKPGTIAYVCTIHPGMAGTLTVEG